jgi:hypothetical protein
MMTTNASPAERLNFSVVVEVVVSDLESWMGLVEYVLASGLVGVLLADGRVAEVHASRVRPLGIVAA